MLYYVYVLSPSSRHLSLLIFLFNECPCRIEVHTSPLPYVRILSVCALVLYDVCQSCCTVTIRVRHDLL